jgi:hypothetical protein
MMWMPFRARTAVSLLCLLALCGCSKFNMVPPCSEMGDGIALALIPNELVPTGAQIDRARVKSLITVSDLSEVNAGYNQRTCRGTLTLNDGSQHVSTTFLIEQSEGAQHWQVVTFLGRGDPAFDQLIQRVQAEYSRGAE